MNIPSIAGSSSRDGIALAQAMNLVISEPLAGRGEGRQNSLRRSRSGRAPSSAEIGIPSPPPMRSSHRPSARHRTPHLLPSSPPPSRAVRPDGLLFPRQKKADIAGHASWILEHLGLQSEAERPQMIVPELIRRLGPALQGRFPTGL